MANRQLMTRTYSELMLLPTFEERFEYLKLSGGVGAETFGWDRWLNQRFYQSPEWQSIRRSVILRDGGCDLAIADRLITGKILVHHINPVDVTDITDRSKWLLNPEFLITVSYDTHQAIHYGDANLLIPSAVTERKPNDTIPWR